MQPVKHNKQMDRRPDTAFLQIPKKLSGNNSAAPTFCRETIEYTHANIDNSRTGTAAGLLFVDPPVELLDQIQAKGVIGRSKENKYRIWRLYRIYNHTAWLPR